MRMHTMSKIAIAMLLLIVSMGALSSNHEGPVTRPTGAGWSGDGFSQHVRPTTPGLGRLAVAQAQPSQPISPVVQIATFKGTTFLKAGSGTIIHPSGLILTNYHVITDAQEGCENVQGTAGTLFAILVTEQGKENDPPVPRFTAVFLPNAEDPAHDLAILQIERLVTNLKDLNALKEAVHNGTFTLQTAPLPPDLQLPVLGLWDSDVLQEGNRLVAQGYPDASDAGLPRLTTSRGSAFTIEPSFLFIENIFTIPGISGGPVIDAESNLVVGIMCGTAVPKLTQGEEMERAVLINLAQPLLRKAPQRVNQVPVADFSWQPLNPKVGTMVTFDASGSRDLDGTIAKHEWDFTGDGKPDATGPSVTFTIPSDQDLSVTLTVMDNEGAAHSRAKWVILQHQAIGVVKIGEQAFPGIQEAIQAARPNDTIIITEGQLQENLIIEGKQNLTLRGAGSDKMTLFGTGDKMPVISIRNSQQIVIEGFTIRDGLVGIRVDNSQQVILKENAIIKNLGRGVELVGATVELVRNRLEDNGEEGLMVRGSAVEVRDNTIRRNKGGGILIRDTARDGEFLKVVLRDNVLEENRIVGVAVARNSSAEIVGSRIEKTQQDDYGRFGIGLEVESGFQAATVREITIMDNAGGGVMIKGLSKLSKVSFVKATIMNNAGNGVMIKEKGQVGFARATIFSNSFFGLIMWGSTETEIKENSQIFGNGYSGILVLNSAQVTIENSQISSNGWHGIALGDFAQANIKNAQISGNKGDGVSLWWGSVKAGISNTQILSNSLNGINLYNFATATITHNRILSNGWNGISMGHSVKATIRGNHILDNQGCGIRVWSSKARVRGDNNQMRGNGADLCRNAPSFLRLPLVPQTSSSASLNVPGDYPTIQEAIDAIAPGGTITLAAGTYEEGLTIWKPLVLRGVGSRQTTLKALAGRKVVVSITAEAQGVSLEELTITGSAWDGLWLQGRATITNVRILGNESAGIEMEGFASATISNTQVSNNNGNGIDIGDQANATISGTQILNNRGNGIIMANASSAIIIDSNILNNERWGIVLWLKQCGFRSDSFIGQVSGLGNEITGNGKKLSDQEKQGGDGVGNVCPKELESLKKR